MGDNLNLSDSVEQSILKNVTVKFQPTTGGLVVAYSSLFIMAVLPILIGAYRSIKAISKQKESGQQIEVLSHKEAAMFPLYASCFLFGLYLVFKLLSKDYVNILLAVYFFVIGLFSLTHALRPLVERLFPASLPNEDYHVVLMQGKDKSKKALIDVEFDNKSILSCCFGAAIGLWYVFTKHWIANNIFGLTFSISGIEMLHLNSVLTGVILLCGLFVYDIFWVFGTDVMVSVAKNFDAPIKLLYPQDFLVHGVFAKHHAMLGLGDIVIPGIFVALLLRFDVSRGPRRTYFYVTYAAYWLGLLITMVVLHVFKSAQPALLYLVPCCVGLPLVVALVKGDIVEMFSYRDVPEISTDDQVNSSEVSSQEQTVSDKKNE